MKVLPCLSRAHELSTACEVCCRELRAAKGLIRSCRKAQRRLPWIEGEIEQALERLDRIERLSRGAKR